MKHQSTSTWNRLLPAIFLAAAAACALACASAAAAQTRRTAAAAVKTETAAPPQYQIFDIGVVAAGDSASQGFGVSPGGTAVGRSVRTGGAQAYTWTAGGLAGLPNLAGRAFCVSNSANNGGAVVGTCASTLFGTSRLPVVWQNGAVAPLPLPPGETLGDANDVNAAGVAVGSVGSGSLQKAVYYSNGTAVFISQTTSSGAFFTTAFGVNDAGRVVGTGIDPNNAARNVGMVYDIGSSAAFEVGALPNANGALAFGVSNAGHVVGSSMLNQGAGLPFIWTPSGGIVAIPLPTGTTQGSARAVNSAGWAVGNASSAFSIPFLYDGAATYRLQDLIPAGTGWDLSMNTSSSALGIGEGGVIVGTGVFNGQTRAYAMVPVANLSLGGRILKASGGGIRGAYVTIAGGGLPAPLATVTGTFGSYNFPGLQAGQTYTVTVTTPRYTLAQPVRSITLATSVADFNFTANPL